MTEEENEEIYDTITLTYDNERYVVEYVYTTSPLTIEILNTEFYIGVSVDDVELLYNVNNKAEELILKRINKSRLYEY